MITSSLQFAPHYAGYFEASYIQETWNDEAVNNPEKQYNLSRDFIEDRIKSQFKGIDSGNAFI